MRAPKPLSSRNTTDIEVFGTSRPAAWVFPAARLCHW